MPEAEVPSASLRSVHPMARAAVACAFACSALAALLTAGCTSPGDDTPDDTPEAAAPGPTFTVVATVEDFEGESFYWHGEQRQEPMHGAPLEAGDRLETGATGRMRVRMADASVLAIGRNTRLALSELRYDRGRSGRIDVALGTFWMQITEWTGSGTSLYEIHTPNAVAGVRGTTLWGDTQVDAICALEGTIEVRSLKDASLAPATLDEGECASELSQGRLAPLTPTKEQLRGYLEMVPLPEPVAP